MVDPKRDPEGYRRLKADQEAALVSGEQPQPITPYSLLKGEHTRAVGEGADQPIVEPTRPGDARQPIASRHEERSDPGHPNYADPGHLPKAFDQKPFDRRSDVAWREGRNENNLYVDGRAKEQLHAATEKKGERGSEHAPDREGATYRETPEARGTLTDAQAARIAKFEEQSAAFEAKLAGQEPSRSNGRGGRD